MTEIFCLKYFCVCLKQSAPLWWVLLLAGQLEHKSRILPVISFCLSPAESGIIVSLMVFKILTFLTTLLSPQISISFVLITLQILEIFVMIAQPLSGLWSIDRSTQLRIHWERFRKCSLKPNYSGPPPPPVTLAQSRV